MDYKQFYVELGRLLYAIAKSDGEVQGEEIDEFYRLVKEELIPIEDSTDEFGTDRAFYTEFEFEALVDKEANVNDTFISFIKYMKANKPEVTSEIKKVCIKAVSRIAKAYKGIERSEQFFIDRLKKELETL